jgi:hypothetical protein
MKKVLFMLAMVLGSQAVAQSVPSVINDLDYKKVEIATEDGELFDAFVVEDDYNTLKKRINKLHVVEVDREGSLLFVVREDDTYEYVSSRGFKFKRITIYEK